VADMGVLTVGQDGLDTATVVSLVCGFVPWAASALCCSVSAWDDHRWKVRVSTSDIAYFH
jgi:hypothetical protein